MRSADTEGGERIKRDGGDAARTVSGARMVAEALLRYPSCLIATHINPEGDAVGSQLGLALALEQRGVQVACYARDGVPENCRFLPTWERVARKLPSPVPPLVVYVDAESLARCGVRARMLSGAETFVRIDHHLTTTPAPGLALVDTSAAAASELVFELLAELGVTLTPEIATCLMTALMVDTGRFCYANTTPTTHHTAARLLEAGANVLTIAEWIWGRTSLAASRLLGLALASLQVSPDGRACWAVLRAQDFAHAGATSQDTEGVIDHVRRVRDTEVAALFSEYAGQIRVSLRSHARVDVEQIARQFGGGGHKRAAGASLAPPIEEAIHHVLQAVWAVLAG